MPSTAELARDVEIDDTDAAAIDDMLRCGECAWLSRLDGSCRVADKRKRMGVKFDSGNIQGDFPTWRYRPNLDIMRRCEFGKKTGE